MTARDVTVTRLFPSGALECSAIVSGYLVHRRYFGHTTREAVRLFLASL